MRKKNFYQLFRGDEFCGIASTLDEAISWRGYIDHDKHFVNVALTLMELDDMVEGIDTSEIWRAAKYQTRGMDKADSKKREEMLWK